MCRDRIFEIAIVVNENAYKNPVSFSNSLASIPLLPCSHSLSPITLHHPTPSKLELLLSSRLHVFRSFLQSCLPPLLQNDSMQPSLTIKQEQTRLEPILHPFGPQYVLRRYHYRPPKRDGLAPSSELYIIISPNSETSNHRPSYPPLEVCTMLSKHHPAPAMYYRLCGRLAHGSCQGGWE